MKPPYPRDIFLTLIFLTLHGPLTAADRPRYEAAFADGTRIVGNKLANWDTPPAAPQLEEQSLLDPAKPLRWLRDRSLSPGASPRAFVEMHSGDRFPGEVIGYYSGSETPFERQPSHFVVRAGVPWKRPGFNDEVEPRVVARFVRRIVWQKRESDRFQPNTIFYRDGSQIGFRSAKFGPGFVGLLLDNGQRQSNFSEIAELHLPVDDPWTAYFDELAVLGPRGPSRLLQLETTDGLLATTSPERFVVHVTNQPKAPDRWIHGLQPAWSLDVLWVPNRDVWVRRSFAPHEVPLSRLPPARGEHKSLIGGDGRRWQVNRNVVGGVLRNLNAEFGSGFGVHAPSELQFQLPAGMCRGFRSQIGLDRAAGAGGCVRARIGLNSSPTAQPFTREKTLFESNFLIGAESVLDTGVLALDANSPRSLVLQVDAADTDRPPGADPLDVRDLTNWFEPELLLDPELLQAEVAKRIPRQIPAWNDWAAELAADGTWQTANVADDLAGIRGGYLWGVAAAKQPFVLRRRMTLDANSRWLVIHATRPAGPPTEPKLTVKVNGMPVAEPVVPIRSAATRFPPPILVPLAVTGEAELEIQQQPDAAGTPVQWRGLQISRQTPVLFELFEDAGQFKADAPDAKATLADDDRHSGMRAVKLPAGSSFHLSAGQNVAIRREPGWGEYRFLRFAFRKAGEGRISLELQHANSRDKPFRLDAGIGEPSYGSARRVWIQRLPNDWLVITRDLFTEFGPFDLTGVTLSAPDGEHVLFDEIYLARSEADFAPLPMK